jgi:mono/diheme cytochrome c family protein
MRSTVLLLILGTAGPATLAACGSARKSEPIVRPLVLSPRVVEQGKVAFMRHCNQCHVRGEAGLGPAINDKPLPAPLVRLQVREGLGAMPAFGEDEISPPDLDRILAYLQALRDRPASPAGG